MSLYSLPLTDCNRIIKQSESKKKVLQERLHLHLFPDRTRSFMVWCASTSRITLEGMWPQSVCAFAATLRLTSSLKLSPKNSELIWKCCRRGTLCMRSTATKVSTVWLHISVWSHPIISRCSRSRGTSSKFPLKRMNTNLFLIYAILNVNVILQDSSLFFCGIRA